MEMKITDLPIPSVLKEFYIHDSPGSGSKMILLLRYMREHYTEKQIKEMAEVND